MINSTLTGYTSITFEGPTTFGLLAGLINANSDQIIFTSGGTAIKLKLISPPVNRPRLVLMLRRKNKNSWVGNVAASHNPLIIYSPFCLFPILTDN